jgi:hypothetical protein
MAAKMTPIGDENAPLTSALAADPPQAPPPPATAEPDDIADPVVPPAILAAVQAPAPEPPPPLPPPTPEWHAHETLLQGFCQHLLRRLDAEIVGNGKELMRSIDAMCMAMKGWIEGQLQHNEHAHYQLSNALAQLQERGLVVVQNPYHATVQVRSPQGYPVTLQLAKRDAGELLDALQTLLPWLQAQHFTADVAAPG